MKTLLIAISLITFSAEAFANTVDSNDNVGNPHYKYVKTVDNSNKENDSVNCNFKSKNCLASNDFESVNKNKPTRKHKKRHLKNHYPAKKIDNQESAKFNTKTNAGDADIEDTSKPNSFISDTNSNNAPAENPSSPPNRR